MEWFKIYKMPDGKPANEFAFNSEPKNKEFAENIIAGCHESWKKLSRYFDIMECQFFGLDYHTFYPYLTVSPEFATMKQAKRVTLMIPTLTFHDQYFIIFVAAMKRMGKELL